MMTRDQLRQHALGTLRKLEADAQAPSVDIRAKEQELLLFVYSLIDRVTGSPQSPEDAAAVRAVRRAGGFVPKLP